MVTRIIIGISVFLLTSIINPVTTSVQAQAQEQLLPDPGVVSYSFRHQFEEDVAGTLDLIKDMGVTNIEFSSLFGKTAQELRAMLDERGLICTSYGVGYDDLVDNTAQVARDAHTLGADYVRIAWIPHESPFSIEDAKRAAEDFNRAGMALKKEGLSFAYHNHGYEFRPYEDGTLFDYLVQHTNPEYVGFEMDLLWVAHPGADPVDLLNKYPNRFILMHLKDLKKGVEGDFSGSAPHEYDVRLGTGQIDFPAVLKAAQDTNIEYFYIEDESDAVVRRVPESIEYLKSLTK
ncbi:sugar phosphate isomerase/epimerase family protein [Fodinibius sediminis]|uniref:Sugar phosphate isomerase/epimerase n=1 Tax=Fodinibius sediminis TaxID=1214077 RepID=A0A521E7T7_9BACT|nr:sugar phosphate isomerase/epimerase [Fodinibius sediminis]SMO80003.1 Sugar phosphate isomerase/epimerase [Fodinibius sediminis]